jgi:hypothetical protein
MREIADLSPPIKNVTRTAFVAPEGNFYRPAAQGGIRRCTALDLALMANSAAGVCWQLTEYREEA